MRTRSVGRVMLYGLLAMVLVGVGCKHPVASAPPPAPAPSTPPPARPTVTLQSSTSTITSRGASP